MKRTALALTFILALLISAIAGIASSKATSVNAESAVPLTISILSPVNGSNFGAGWVNQTSYVLEVNFPLIYETNEVPSWVGYSFNGNSNVTVSENSTVVEQTTLAQGIFPEQNSLTLYANDTFGNWATPQTITFLIVTSPHPTPTSTPTVPEFPTWIILPLFAVMILLSTIFIRKRMPKKIAQSFLL